jgi:hypothetical protein
MGDKLREPVSRIGIEEQHLDSPRGDLLPADPIE